MKSHFLYNSFLLPKITSQDFISHQSSVVEGFIEQILPFHKKFCQYFTDMENQSLVSKISITVLRRLVFLYYIQKHGFLDTNTSFLENILTQDIQDNYNFAVHLQNLLREIPSKERFPKPASRITFFDLNLNLFNDFKEEFQNIYHKIPNSFFQQLFETFNQFQWKEQDFSGNGHKTSNLLTSTVIGYFFEQMLAIYHLSEEERKASGIFYTPSNISLFLAEITVLLQLTDNLNRTFNCGISSLKDVLLGPCEPHLCRKILHVLKNIKIIDNACGSGAFLVSVLQILTVIWFRAIFPLLSDLSKIDSITSFLHKWKFPLSWLPIQFSSQTDFMNNKRWKWVIKSLILSNSLFGVDRDSLAIENVKMRLWLNLVSSFNFGIEEKELPFLFLPSLDYSLRVGNSLVGYTSLPSEIITKDFKENEDQISSRLKQLANIDRAYLDFYPSLRNPITFGTLLKIQICLVNHLQNSIDSSTYRIFYSIYREFHVFLTENLSKHFVVNESSVLLNEDSENLKCIQIFHWSLEFPTVFLASPSKDCWNNTISNIDTTTAIKNGFDIIIGNPPYGNLLTAHEKSLHYLQSMFHRSEISALFTQHSFSLLSSSGRLCYVLPKSISFYSSWQAVRKFLLTKSLELILDIGLGFADVNAEQIALLICAESQSTIPKNTKSLQNLTQIAVASPQKKRSVIKEIEILDTLPQSLMRSENIILLRSFTMIETRFIKLLQAVSHSFDTLYLNPCFRGLYVPNDIKKSFSPGSTFWVDKVPYIKKYALRKLMAIDVNDTLQKLSVHLAGRNQDNTEQKWLSLQKKVRKICQPRLLFKVLRGNRIVCFPDIEGKLLTTEKVVNVVFPREKTPFILAYLAILNSPIPSFYIQKMVFSGTTETSRVLDNPYMKAIPIPKTLNFSEYLIVFSQFLLILRQDAENHANMFPYIHFIQQKLILPVVLWEYFKNLKNQACPRFSILGEEILMQQLTDLSTIFTEDQFIEWWRLTLKITSHTASKVQIGKYEEMCEQLRKKIIVVIEPLYCNSEYLRAVKNFVEHEFFAPLWKMYPQDEEKWF